jgi:hypothetical protein
MMRITVAHRENETGLTPVDRLEVQLIICVDRNTTYDRQHQQYLREVFRHGEGDPA